MFDKFNVLCACNSLLIGVLPIVSKMLVVPFNGGLDAGVTVALGRTELGILLKTLTSLLLELGRSVTKVGMTMAKLGVTVAKLGVTMAEVGRTVTEGGNTIVEVTTILAEEIRVRVLLIPVVDLLNETVEGRELEFIETVLLAPNTIVEVCMISLDLTTSLLLNTVVSSCDFKVEVTKLELNMAEVIVRLVSGVDITVLVELMTEVSTGETAALENGTLVFETATELLRFANTMEDDTGIGLLPERIVVVNEESMMKRPLELGRTAVESTPNNVDEIVLFAEIDEFTSFVTALDSGEELLLVLETMVEFTRTSDLVVNVTNIATSDEFVSLVKFGLNSTLETMLVNWEVLNDESEPNKNVAVVIFGVDEMLMLGLSTPSELLRTTVRLAAKVLGNFRVPLVLVSRNSDDVTITIDDLTILDVEFTNAVLLAVEGNFEMKTWVRYKLRHNENSVHTSMQHYHTLFEEGACRHFMLFIMQNNLDLGTPLVAKGNERNPK